jgi:uncharacterized repeat protein (TIGR01451 family)
MVRTTTIILGLLFAVGIVVAMLPAQESSRRRVYGGAMDDYDPAPAPEPGLLSAPDNAVPATSPPASSPAADLQAPRDAQVAPAGIFGRGRRGGGSLSDQLEMATEAATEEYNPTPAQGSSIYDTAPRGDLAPESVPTSQPPATLPPGIGAAPAPLASEAAAPSSTSEMAAPAGPLQSVLKRPPTTRVSDEPPPRVPVMPSTTPPTARVPTGPSSRRPITTPIGDSYSGGTPAAPPRRSVSSPRTAPIDTRSITGLAASGKSPALRVDVAGPQGIQVGKAETYSLTLVNEGETPAREVLLRVALPGFVTLSGSEASAGDAGMQADASGQPRLVWRLPELAGRGQETLRLELTASAGQPFELAAEWTCQPATVAAAIEVMQAELQVTLVGPAEMVFGSEQTFTMTVANPGTGNAENVVVNLSAGGARPQQFEVGQLAAGQQQEIPVKIVASQPGEMQLAAVAAGDGNLEARAQGKVIVRQAQLAVTVDAPPLKFAGSEATFAVTVRNQGDAPAEQLQVTAALPAGAEYVRGINGAVPVTGGIRWTVGTLPPGGEKTFELQAALHGAGENVLGVRAQAASGITAEAQGLTMVEAVADLKLVVNDPAGPLGTSELAVYDVQVMNRGTESAREVKIVMQFGEGIEPIAFEGAEARVVPGQVICQPLAELGPGEQVTIKVKARADRSGSHQFRVEVVSDQAEARLVSEGTTRFFAERGAAATTARKPSLVPQQQR